MMLHQRVEMAERDRGAMEHGNFLELEKVDKASPAKIHLLIIFFVNFFFLFEDVRLKISRTPC